MVLVRIIEAGDMRTVEFLEAGSETANPIVFEVQKETNQQGFRKCLMKEYVETENGLTCHQPEEVWIKEDELQHPVEWWVNVEISDAV